MILTDVYARPDRATLLWGLLCQRDDTVNISHRRMPTFEEHDQFVESRPYEDWCFIHVEGDIVGACYLSKQSEIGVFIFGDSQGKGYGEQAVRGLMGKHGRRRYLANINPRNLKSIKLFNQLGFKHIQNTYECVSGCS